MSSNASRLPDDSVPPSLFGVEEAARRLGLAPKTVYNLIAAGRLGCYRIGQPVRFAEYHIAEFLERHESRAVR